MHKYSVHQILYLITKQFDYDYYFIRPGSVGPAVMEFVYLQWVHSVFHKRSNFCVQLRKLSNFRELLNLPGVIIFVRKNVVVIGKALILLIVNCDKMLVHYYLLTTMILLNKESYIKIFSMAFSKYIIPFYFSNI